MNDSKFIHLSSFNYQKVFDNDSQTISVAPPSGPDFLPQVITIPHNLGYIPTVRAWFSPTTGQIWPLTGKQFNGMGDTGNYYLTTTDLIIEFSNNTGVTKDYTFYYRIYYDE